MQVLLCSNTALAEQPGATLVSHGWGSLFLLACVFVAARGLFALAEASGGDPLATVTGFHCTELCCGAWPPGSRASVAEMDCFQWLQHVVSSRALGDPGAQAQ